MGAKAKPYKILSANLEDGIKYEIARERITVQIASKVAEMDRNGTSDNPTKADIDELRALVRKRESISGTSR